MGVVDDDARGCQSQRVRRMPEATDQRLVSGDNNMWSVGFDYAVCWSGPRTSRTRSCEKR